MSKKNIKRLQRIQKDKQELEENMRKQMEVMALLSPTNSTISEEDSILILNCQTFPELLQYIINIKNQMHKTMEYPTDPSIALRKYLEDRRNKEYLALPEIMILLYKLGFNMTLKGSFYLAMYFAEKIEPEFTLPVQLNNPETMKTIEDFQNKAYKPPLRKKVLKNPQMSNQEIINTIELYIYEHPDMFISEKKPLIKNL